jgi:fumiquinazoline A oxidase
MDLFLTTAIGTATCVGMIGATLGGGVSTLQGAHGLLIDTLVSVRLVTAEGNAITVSAEENPDLFWGIRGAGHNFGIITSATYNIFDSTNAGQVLSADILYPSFANHSIWEALKSFDDELPAGLAINIVVAFDPNSYGVRSCHHLPQDLIGFG